MKLTTVDLFSGVGGVATGFRSAGIKTLLAVEKVKSCVDTYAANHHGTIIIHDDVMHLKDEDFERAAKEQGKPLIASAGPPCETFSTAGPGTRRYDDSRNFLFERAVRLADISGAKIFVFENVPGFASKRVEYDHNEKILDLLFKRLDDAGFKRTDAAILNAANFGTPQIRNRFILMATRNGPRPKLPHKTHSLSHNVTSWDALSDLPQIGHSQESNIYRSKPKNKYQETIRNPSFWKIQVMDSRLKYHITPKHRPLTIERFKLIKQGEGLKDLFMKLDNKRIELLQKKGVLPKSWYIQRNRRLIPNRPSFTITSHCLDEIIHPFLNRSLSVREVARLQGFPDCYDFRGGPIVIPHIYEEQDKYEQIGDAVPPLLAREIGLSIVDMME